MTLKEIRDRPGTIFRFQNDINAGIEETHMIISIDNLTTNDHIYCSFVALNWHTQGTIFVFYEWSDIIHSQVIIRDTMTINSRTPHTQNDNSFPSKNSFEEQ